MSQIENSAVHSLSADDELEYKSLSLIAVASFGLGVLSIFALLHTSLWVIPVLAILVGLIARRRIARNQSSSGSLLALLGISLGLFFVSCAVSSFFLHRKLVRQTAHQFCDEWLDLVQDKQLYKAYELTRFFEARRPPNSNLVSLYGPIPDVTKEPQGPIGIKNEFQKYWTSSPQKELILFGNQPSSKLRLERFGIVLHEFVAEFRFKRDTVQLIYLFEYEENGEQKAIRFAVNMARRWTAVEHQHWFVDSVEVWSEVPADTA